MEFKNTVTNEIIEASGCWNSSEGIAFLSGQSHTLTDFDSPIKWDLNLVVWDSRDEMSEESYDLYVLPADWQVEEN